MAVAELGYKIKSDEVKTAKTRLDEMGKSAIGADKASDKLSNTSNRLATSLGGAVGKMVAFAAAAVSIGVVARTLAQFEDGMARLGAITRASESDLARLRDTAKSLGASTEFSATQAADGLTFLGQAGFTAAQSMAAIPAVLDLATASGMGLAQAADTASNIMSGFGIAASDAAQVADVLAAASSRANTDVAQLGSAMSTVAPISKALGIDLNATAAAIGVMSDAGIQGERAGTALRGVLASLAGPTKQASDALSKYGLSAKDVDPQIHGLSKVLETLQARGISTADAMTIFGREAASGALVLIEASKRVGEFSDELSQAEGEAGRMAGTMRDALGGSFKTLSSSVEALILAMGDAGLTAVIKAAIDAATLMVRAITSVVEWLDKYKGYVIAAATAATAYLIPSIVGIIGTMGTAIATTAVWIASLITLRGALIATGLGAIIVLAGSLINLMLRLVKETGGWGAALELLGEVASGVWDGIKASAGAIPVALNAIWMRIKAEFLVVLEIMTSKWRNFLTMLSGIGNIPGFEALGKSLSDSAASVDKSVTGFMTAANDAFVESGKLSDEATKIATAGFDKAREAAGKLAAQVEQVNEQIDNVGGEGSGLGGSGGLGGGLGGVGDGSKGSKGDKASRIQMLIESLRTEQELLAEWHAQSQLDLMLASDTELELIGGRNEAKLRLEEEYQTRLAAISVVGHNSQLEHLQGFLGDAAGLMQAGNEKLFKIGKMAAIAQAVVDGYSSAVSAWKKGMAIGGPPVAAAFSALSVAKTAGLIASLKSASFSGGGSSSAGGGGGASGIPQQSEQKAPQTRAIIQAVGGRTRFTVDEINDIIAGIQKESKDGVIIEGFSS